MRRSLVVLAALFMLASSKHRDTFVLTFDNMTMTHGTAGATDVHVLAKRYGDRFAYFTRGSRSYVIRDEDTISRLQSLYAAQIRLGQKQAELGSKQAALGLRQADLGSEQARVGMEQASTSSSSSRYQRLVDRQNELARKQNELSEQQNKLSDQQNEMGRQQNELQAEADRRADEVLERAVRTGIAVDVTGK